MSAPNLEAVYAAANCNGKRVYKLENEASRVIVFVGKTGALSGAGHVHVILVGKLHGFARIGPGTDKADLYFPVRSLRVDPPALRNALGGEYAHTNISDEQRAGTRRHMLGAATLAASVYPRVRLSITRSVNSKPNPLRIRLTLHGQTRTIIAPATVEVTAQALVVDGTFHIRQSRFGITPYSILLGALSVSDRLGISYHLVFNRWQPPDANSCSTPI